MRFLRPLLLAVVFLLPGLPAFGQAFTGPAAITQPTTANHCVKIVSGNTITDAGATCGTSSATGANPTAIIGAAAVNGSALTFMRSDAAPALPATLPALNGSLLTNLSGANLIAGSVANAALTNPATTVNGQSCTLGASCTVTAAASGVTIGTTTVGGGVSGRILYDNGGLLAENTVTGTGSVVEATGPTLVSPALGTPTVLVLTNASGLPDSALSANVPLLNMTNAFTGNNALSGSFTLSGRTDATIAADQNNWTPTGTGTYANSSEVFVDGGVSDRNITGLTGGVAGRIVGIVNKGTTNSIIIKNSSGSSSAANQFLLPADVTLPPNTALEMRYDGTASAWRPWGRALANTGVTAGSYTYSSMTVDISGRVTAAANGAAPLPLTGGTLTGAVTVNSNVTSAPTPITGAGLLVNAADGVTARVQAMSYGAIAAFSTARANGTAASPTGLVNADQIGGVNGYGWTSAAALAGPAYSYRGYATETWSGTANGTKACVATTANTTTTLTDKFCVEQDGSLTAAGATSFGNVNFTANTTPSNGFSLTAANQITISTNAANRGNFTTADFRSATTGGFLLPWAAGTCTAPSLVPQRSATTTGYSGDSTKLCGVLGGVEKVDWTANGTLSAGYVQAGSITAYTGLQAGDIAMTYHSDVATAPGSGGCYLAWVPATTTGRKLVARCNTSTTAVTIVDNVGN